MNEDLIRIACELLTVVHKTHHALLPKPLRDAEWQLQFSVKGEPNRWRELTMQYPGEPALETLQRLAEALTALDLILHPPEEPTAPPNLTLTKTRSHFGGHEGGTKLDPRYEERRKR